MKNTTQHKFTNDDTIVCPTIRGILRNELARHASMELCESIVAEVEFRALCNLIRETDPVDMTDHAVLEN